MNDREAPKAHPWRAWTRSLAADLADGLDAGLTEVLRVLGIDRTSRAQRRAAAQIAARLLGSKRMELTVTVDATEADWRLAALRARLDWLDSINRERGEGYG